MDAYTVTFYLPVETELPQHKIHHLETDTADKDYVHNELIQAVPFM